jgi:hypothetical protein
MGILELINFTTQEVCNNRIISLWMIQHLLFFSKLPVVPIKEMDRLLRVALQILLDIIMFTELEAEVMFLIISWINSPTIFILIHNTVLVVVVMQSVVSLEELASIFLRLTSGLINTQPLKVPLTVVHSIVEIIILLLLQVPRSLEALNNIRCLREE